MKSPSPLTFKLLLLFGLLFFGILGWMYFGDREDARESRSSRFQVLVLVDDGGHLKPVLLPWSEYQGFVDKGQKHTFLVPEAEESRIREELRQSYHASGGDSCDLTVTRLGPDRQALCIRTEGEGAFGGGKYWSSSSYEATASEVYPQQEWRFYLAFTTFFIVAIFAGMGTVGIAAIWWLFSLILQSFLGRQRTGSATPSKPPVTKA